MDRTGLEHIASLILLGWAWMFFRFSDLWSEPIMWCAMLALTVYVYNDAIRYALWSLNNPTR